MAKYNLNRRHFIKQASCAAIGSTTFLSSFINLKAIAASSIFNSSTLDCGGYKALVCLFQSGGNDSFNMLIPRTQTEYNAYSASRSNLAIPLNEVLPIYPTNTPGRDFGVHPNMPHLQNLFNNGKAAFVSNAGTLIAPLTKQEFYDEAVAIPLGLYSHSDQAMHWQTGFANARAANGWAGRISDLLQDANSNSSVSMNLSLAGSNILQSGFNTTEYSLNPIDGATLIDSDTNFEWIPGNPVKQAVTNMVDATYADIFHQTYKNKVKVSREGAELVNDALQGAPEFDIPFTQYPGSPWEALPWFSNSMEMVAKMISIHSALGATRQIYFVDFGGWDHHDELLNTQSEMLGAVDTALYEFNAAMEQLGLSECVTTFSLSEFSRTLTSNGNGTDHAWGANVFAMGGAVNGQKIYGTYPDLSLNGPLEVGGGVFIPTTAAEQYFAELALWFGVPESSLFDLFPNLPNFYEQGSGNPLGFLNI